MDSSDNGPTDHLTGRCIGVYSNMILPAATFEIQCGPLIRSTDAMSNWVSIFVWLKLLIVCPLMRSAPCTANFIGQQWAWAAMYYAFG